VKESTREKDEIVHGIPKNKKQTLKPHKNSNLVNPFPPPAQSNILAALHTFATTLLRL
jgi:hypothetical protein